MDQRLFKLAPDLRERVWGGSRLGRLMAGDEAARTARKNPIGEAWIAFEGSVVENGPAQGTRVGEMVVERGEAIVGTTYGRASRRFPLLIKLLDTADWLSVQVHPNDEQARRMVGPDEFGKTEAWLFLEAEPGATILAGVKPGTSRDQLVGAVRDRTLLDVAAEVPVRSGEAMLVPAGMVHALGPGLFLYEVQQSSDTTYRAYDWGRPETPERRLHVEECAAVMEPHEGRLLAAAEREDSVARRIVESAYFAVDAYTASRTVDLRTSGSFHLATVLSGAVELCAGAESVHLAAFETALVAAETGSYEVRPSGRADFVIASVPGDQAAVE